MAEQKKKYPWWISEVVYQIYPRSFKDSNEDGIGDLAGITSKLDYLKDLGITMIWLSPCFLSPMVDNGYDISDYLQIAPDFGTMEDMDELIAEAGRRGIRLMLDLVVNHSSDEHEWFKKALADPAGRDYYHFVASDKVPNNWRSIFGGSVWEKIPGENVYYYHTFHPKQPDLNWENPRVRRDVINIVRWWLDKGIAGFRVDAITFLKKEEFSFSAAPDGVDGRVDVGSFGRDVEGIGEFLTQLRREGFDYRPCLTVAEAYGVKEENRGKYIGESGYFDMMFDFVPTELDFQDTWLHPRDWTVREWGDQLMKVQMDTRPFGWPANFLENHDQPRAASKYLKNNAHNPEAVKTLGAMYFFMRGIPFIYQGQELGMVNFRRERIEEFNDLSSHDLWKRGLEEGMRPEEIIGALNLRSRDHGRTPFPWNNERYGGFSETKPWLGMTEEYPEINAEAQMADPDSIFSFYRSMISFRREGKWSDCLLYGDISPLESHDRVIAYLREYEGRKLRCWFNLSGETVEEVIPDDCTGEIWHTGEAPEREGKLLRILPWQSVILS